MEQRPILDIAATSQNTLLNFCSSMWAIEFIAHPWESEVYLFRFRSSSLLRILSIYIFFCLFLLRVYIFFFIISFRKGTFICCKELWQFQTIENDDKRKNLLFPLVFSLINAEKCVKISVIFISFYYLAVY